MKEKIKQLLDKWKLEDDAIQEKVNVLFSARKILPAGMIDAPINNLLAERGQLMECRSDLQQLLFIE